MKLRAQALLKVEPQVFRSDHFALFFFPLSVEDGHCHNHFLIGEMPTANNPGSESQKFLGLAMGAQLRRLRQPRSLTAAQLHPGQLRPAAEPVLLRPPYNDVSHGQFKPEAPYCRPMVSTGIRAAGAFGLQRSLDQRSVAATGSATRNGKIAVRSAPIIIQYVFRNEATADRT